MNPLYVSFYTPDYEDCALDCGADFQRNGIPLYIAPMHHKFQNWMEATYAKAFFLKDVLAGLEPEYDSVVWVDADSRLRSWPHLLQDLSPAQYDIAAHRYVGKELLSGTLWIAKTPKAQEVVKLWCDYNGAGISCLEQRNLSHAIRDTDGVRFNELPAAYCYIFDLSRRQYPGETPVIEHFQRSRETRRKERSHA